MPKIELPEKFLINDNMIDPPAPAEEMDSVEVIKGPNIKDFPESHALEDSITADVVLKVGDNITTDHIMPAGAKILPYRSNIPLSVQLLLRRLRQGIPERCKKLGGGFVVGGENYGQGSSREHAALVPSISEYAQL